MRKRNRMVIVGAASLAGLLLAACGNNGNAPAGHGEVTIGGLWAQSGPQAGYGDWMTKGAQMAVDEINAKGGIGGKTKINLEIIDTKALPEPAVVAFQKLASEKVNYVMSSFSSQTLALMPIANSRKIVVVNGGAQSDALGETGDFLFNTLPLLHKESAVLAAYLHNEAKAKTAAIINTSDDGGKAARDDFANAFKADGGKIVGSQGGPFGGTDFRSQLTKLKTTNPDVLVIGAFGQDSAVIINQVREIGWDVQLANTSWVAIPPVLKSKSAEGLILTTIPFNPSQSFVNEYKKRVGEVPNSAFIGNYYDAVMMFAKAYESLTASGKQVDGASLADAIRSIHSFDSSYGTPLTFDDKGVASRPIDVGVIRQSAVHVIGKDYQK